MRNTWKLKYEDHSIHVENSLLSDKLYVDGVLQDEHIGMHLSSRLFGKLKNSRGEWEDVKISLSAKCPNTECRIFVGERLIYSTSLQWDM